MKQYQLFSLIIFVILMLLLGIIAVTKNTMLIIALVGVVPLFVLVQVFGILKSKEEVPQGQFDDWYENK